MRQNLLRDISFSEESTDEPVTLDEVKLWLKVDVTDDDTLITSLITAARQQCENYLNISLIERTVTATLQNELGNIELPYGPVQEIEEMSDSDGGDIAITDTTFGGSQFKWLIGNAGVTVTATPRNNFYTPCHSYVTVTYSAGYAAEEFPQRFKTALLNQIAFLYENRGSETAQEMGNTTILLLKPYRRVT